MKKVLRRLQSPVTATRPQGPTAEPPWTQSFGGLPLIILGSAPCAAEDLAFGRTRFVDPHIMALKEAVVLTDDILHLFTAHSDRCEALVAYRATRYPDIPVPHVHTMRTTGFRVTPGATHLWTHVSARGSSVQPAIQIARAMGYGRILLCGCPMNQAGYFNQGTQLTGFRYDRQRIGDDPKTPHALMMRQKLEQYLAGVKDVYSMSGWTRELLGLPPQK